MERHDDRDAARLAGARLTEAQVRARFRWAKRQGRPAWLWPDTAITDWRRALAAIEATIAARLGGARPVPLRGQPETIGLACYTSGTGPLLGWWHARGEIEASEAIGALLAAHLDHNRRRVATMTEATRSLAARWAARGIRAVVLKGMHTAHTYFPDPATRPASDIDLLVRAPNLDAAEADLTGTGYRLTGRAPWESNWRHASSAIVPQTLMLAHADDPWAIDLHGALAIRPGQAAPIARLDDDGPSAAQAAWPPSAEADVLPQPVLLLHLAVHAGAGLHNLTLLRLIELDLVIEQDARSGTLDWQAFLSLAERTGGLAYAYPALALCERLSPGRVPAFALARCRAAAPPAVRRIVARLTPATAQRVDRISIAEHFMWAEGWGGRLRQIGADLAPGKASLVIYERRAWSLLRGAIGR